MNLQRRIEQLEARMGITPGRPHLIITNVRFADDALESGAGGVHRSFWSTSHA